MNVILKMMKKRSDFMTVTGYIILSLVFLAIWFINRPEKEKTMKDIKKPNLDSMERMAVNDICKMYRDSIKELKGDR